MKQCIVVNWSNFAIGCNDNKSKQNDIKFAKGIGNFVASSKELVGSKSDKKLIYELI